MAARLVESHGERLEEPIGAVTHRFPTSSALARIDPSSLPMPHSRAPLGDPDAYPLGDVGLRRALERRGNGVDRAGEELLTQSWRPWRSYAVVHLWRSLGAEPVSAAKS